MRIIGRIEPKFSHTGIGTVENSEYVNGCIVELTAREVYTLKALQDACDGKQWRTGDLLEPYRDKPVDENMAESFALVWTFAQTRFAINDFKSIIAHLDETITRLDKLPNEL